MHCRRRHLYFASTRIRSLLHSPMLTNDWQLVLEQRTAQFALVSARCLTEPPRLDEQSRHVQRFDFATQVKPSPSIARSWFSDIIVKQPMRAYYSTHKHIRLFVLGTPEGWHVGLYDIQNRKWTDLDGAMRSTLKEAKADAQNKAVSIFGSKTPELKWH